MEKTIAFRQETEADYETVEELTREAFWNFYVPGCDEHLLAHKLRKAQEFVRDLDLVAVTDGKIVANIMYMEAKVIDRDGKEHTVLTFGPLSVLPQYRNKGIASELIKRTTQFAKEMGYKAILIYGDPEYYKRFGFEASKKYGISDSEGKFPAALQVLELYPNALSEIKGVFDEGEAYRDLDEKELQEFEKKFATKHKLKTKTQERFTEVLNTYL